MVPALDPEHAKLLSQLNSKPRSAGPLNPSATTTSPPAIAAPPPPSPTQAPGTAAAKKLTADELGARMVEVVQSGHVDNHQELFTHLNFASVAMRLLELPPELVAQMRG